MDETNIEHELQILEQQINNNSDAIMDICNEFKLQKRNNNIFICGYFIAAAIMLILSIVLK